MGQLLIGDMGMLVASTGHASQTDWMSYLPDCRKPLDRALCTQALDLVPATVTLSDAVEARIFSLIKRRQDKDVTRIC